MATITPKKITEEGVATGTSPALAAASTGGDEFTNTGVEFIRVRNDHADAGYTVTITAQTTSYSFPRHGKLTKANTVIAIGANTSVFIGPFKPTVWNDANGKVQITYKLTSDNSAITGSHLLKTEVLYLEQK